MKLDDVRALVVFEPAEERKNFFPISLTKPTFDFLFGTRTIVDRIEQNLGKKVTNLFVPEYLFGTTKETHPNIKVNESVNETCLVINSLVSSRIDLSHLAKKLLANKQTTTLLDPITMNPVLAVLDGFGKENSLLSGTVKSNHPTKKLVHSERAIIQYPWQMIDENSDAISSDYANLGSNQNRALARTSELLGNRLLIRGESEVGKFVTFDSRKGPIIIDEGAEIQSMSHLTGPCYVGRKSVVKSAKIREGSSVGEGCRVSGEVEETIISPYTNKNHEGFIGHSIVGSWVNLGAMTSNSDLKNTYGAINVKVGEFLVKTGSIKVGTLIGDMVKTAIGTMIYSGKKIGVGSHLFGTVTEDVPSFTLFGKSLGAESKEMYLESVLETQKRMMSRRGHSLTRNQEDLIRAVFRLTSQERKKNSVRKGKFAFA